MSVLTNDIYNKLMAAGVGGTRWACMQLEEACADMIGDKFNADEFISNLQSRGEWHHSTLDKIRTLLEPYNGELVRSTPRTLLNALIENAQARGAKASQKAPEREAEPPVWLTVYKDTLGYPEDHDNLTEILVPGKWLMDCFRADGTDTEEWFAEYTADDTEDIARKALADGVILDCSNERIKTAMLGSEKMKATEPER